MVGKPLQDIDTTILQHAKFNEVTEMVIESLTGLAASRSKDHHLDMSSFYINTLIMLYDGRGGNYEPLDRWPRHVPDADGSGVPDGAVQVWPQVRRGDSEEHAC